MARVAPPILAGLQPQTIVEQFCGSAHGRTGEDIVRNGDELDRGTPDLGSISHVNPTGTTGLSRTPEVGSGIVARFTVID
jgi:hypothetical protein